MPTIAEVRQQYPQYQDMSDGELADALHAKFYADMPREQFDAKIGEQQTPSAPTAPTAPAQQNSESLGFIKEGLAPFQRLSTGVESGLERIGYPAGKIRNAMGMPSEQQASDAVNKYVARREARGQVPGKIGGALGVAAATIPIMAVTRNPWAGGALSGAFTSDAPDAQGMAIDTALGAVGGKIGDKVIRTVGAAVSPHIAPAVKKLLEAGIPLTPGQIRGGLSQTIEDKAMSLPFAGDMIREARLKGQEGFRQAAVNRVLQPLGEKLPAGIGAGQEAVAHAQDVVGAAYNGLLPNLKIAADPELTSGFARVLAGAKATLPKERFDQIAKTINREITPTLRAAPNGETFKTIQSELRREAADWAASATKSERDVGKVFKGLAKELDAMLKRQNPQAAERLGQIDEAYANLKRINAAAAAATEGKFSPAQLRTATRQQDRSLGKRISARGEALLQDLADAGQSVMSGKIPDSGTAGRMAMNGFGALGLLGALKTPPGQLAAASLGLLSAAYSKPGQVAARGLLTARPAGAPALRKVIEQAGLPAGLLLGTSAVQARPKDTKTRDKR